MSARHTSAFDDLLAKNRRELDALYEGIGSPRADRLRSGSSIREPAAATPAPNRAPAAGPTEQLLDKRYGSGWRFEVTSRRRERDEVIVVGTLRLPLGRGGIRTQFGSARIAAGGGGTAGSAGGSAFSFGGSGIESPLAAEEAAFERAREDALANCAALL